MFLPILQNLQLPDGVAEIVGSVVAIGAAFPFIRRLFNTIGDRLLARIDANAQAVASRRAQEAADAKADRERLVQLTAQTFTLSTERAQLVAELAACRRNEDRLSRCEEECETQEAEIRRLRDKVFRLGGDPNEAT